MALSKQFVQAVLDRYFNSVAHAIPASVEVRLFTTMPSDDDPAVTGVEAAGADYERQTVETDGTGFTAAAGRRVSNSADVDFGIQSEALGTLRGYGLYDPAGALIGTGAFAGSGIVSLAGRRLIFPAGTLYVEVN